MKVVGHRAGGIYGRRHRRLELPAVARSRAWSAVTGAQQIDAIVPLSEMFGYATDLRSKTQGRGQYTMEPSHYIGGSEVDCREHYAATGRRKQS